MQRLRRTTKEGKDLKESKEGKKARPRSGSLDFGLNLLKGMPGARVKQQAVLKQIKSNSPDPRLLSKARTFENGAPRQSKLGPARIKNLNSEIETVHVLKVD